MIFLSSQNIPGNLYINFQQKPVDKIFYFVCWPGRGFSKTTLPSLVTKTDNPGICWSADVLVLYQLDIKTTLSL
jgi:hypothetical protein